MTHRDKPDEHDEQDETATSEGQVSESAANPTPPSEDATTSPGVEDSPQLPPDQQKPRGR